MAADAQFRPDLFYRLSVITSNCRRCGIEKGTSNSTGTFLAQCRGRRKRPFRLTREAARRLRSYPYPGNVRELENAVRRAVALCPNDMITVALPASGDCGRQRCACGSAAPRNEQTILGDRPTHG